MFSDSSGYQYYKQMTFFNSGLDPDPIGMREPSRAGGGGSGMPSYGKDGIRTLLDLDLAWDAYFGISSDIDYSSYSKSDLVNSKDRGAKNYVANGFSNTRYVLKEVYGNGKSHSFTGDDGKSYSSMNIEYEWVEVGVKGASSQGGGYGKDIVSGVLTAEGAYSTLLHNHTTYQTTKGVIKNIYKANGQVRSVRAQTFANTSRTLKYVGEAGNVVTTGMAYYDIAAGNQQAITYVDAGVGTMGIIASGASYFYGVQIPVVGEVVAIYGTLRLTWDVLFNLGANYGPSTWSQPKQPGSGVLEYMRENGMLDD